MEDYIWYIIAALLMLWVYAERRAIIGIRYYQWKFGVMDAARARHLAKEWAYIAKYNLAVHGNNAYGSKLLIQSQIMEEYVKLLEAQENASA